MTEPNYLTNFLNHSTAIAMKDSYCLHEWLGTSGGFHICKICECEISDKAYNLLRELENDR